METNDDKVNTSFTPSLVLTVINTVLSICVLRKIFLWRFLVIQVMFDFRGINS